MPRPYARTEQVQTTLHPDELERLEAYRGERCSRADAIRQFVLTGLDAAAEEERDRARRVLRR